jgi:hypothetical protein
LLDDHLDKKFYFKKLSLIKVHHNYLLFKNNLIYLNNPYILKLSFANTIYQNLIIQKDIYILVDISKNEKQLNLNLVASLDFRKKFFIYYFINKSFNIEKNNISIIILDIPFEGKIKLFISYQNLNE